MLKPGSIVLDPHNRRVTVVEVLPDAMVRVRLAGFYGASLLLPASCLRPVEES